MRPRAPEESLMENASRPPSEVLRLLKPFLPWMALSVVTGICAGGATVALLATINQVLNRPGGLAGGLLLTFIALCATVLVCRATSDMSGNFVGQRLVRSEEHTSELQSP